MGESTDVDIAGPDASSVAPGTTNVLNTFVTETAENASTGDVETLDQLTARHKKEGRDLVATTTSLKKQATKKTRKSVNQKCQDMQTELDQRHKRELAHFNGLHVDDVIEEVTPEQLLASLQIEPEAQPITNENGSVPGMSAPLAKKRNRAKEKLAKRQAQEAAVRAQAAEEAAGETDYRKIEADLMNRLLAAQNLELHEVKPDGHCLFRSIQDQLQWRQGVDVLVSDLRKSAADYIRAHSDDFVPYLFDEATLSLRDIGAYTKELEETAMWGSDMELLALSKTYNCSIRVLMAGSAPIVFHDDAEDELVVAFYKHLYGLGEHYNSCRSRKGDE